ncbi:MAG: hypothetical protein ACYDAK_13980, partial [Candidatus Limnocylindrales bacterium]
EPEEDAGEALDEAEEDADEIAEPSAEDLLVTDDDVVEIDVPAVDVPPLPKGYVAEPDEE